jgi:hypothetical protein
VGGHRIAGQFRAVEDCDGHAAAPEKNGNARSCDSASDDDYIVFCAHDRSRSDNQAKVDRSVYSRLNLSHPMHKG